MLGLAEKEWGELYSPRNLQLLREIKKLRFGQMNIKIHQGEPVGIEKRLESIKLDGK